MEKHRNGKYTYTLYTWEGPSNGSGFFIANRKKGGFQLAAHSCYVIVAGQETSMNRQLYSLGSVESLMCC